MTSSEGAEDGGWRLGGALPPDLTPTAVCADPDGGGYVCGWTAPPGAGLDTRCALVLRVTSEGAVTEQLRQAGWVVAAQVDGARVVVLLASADGRRWVQVSLDRGATWQQLPDAPVRSLTAVHGAGEDVWTLGADTLGRWRGRAWEAVSPPVPGIDVTRHRLASAEGHCLLLGPEGVYIWREDTCSWARRRCDGLHARRVCSPFVAAVAPGGVVRLGRLEQAWVSWLGQITGGADVAALSVGRWAESGALAVQLLLVPCEPAERPGPVLVRSAATGGLEVERLRLPPHAAWADVAGCDAVLGVTLDRRVLLGTAA